MPKIDWSSTSFLKTEQTCAQPLLSFADSHIQGKEGCRAFGLAQILKLEQVRGIGEAGGHAVAIVEAGDLLGGAVSEAGREVRGRRASRRRAGDGAKAADGTYHCSTTWVEG